MIKQGLSKGCKDSSVYANWSMWENILTNSKIKTMSHVIISVDAEKLLGKFNTHLGLKNKKSAENGYRGNIPQNNKGYIWQNSANKLLSGENLKASPLRSGIRPGIILSYYYYLT